MDLITRSRALRNLATLTPTSAENDTIDGLITACSAAIESFCRRVFAVQTYDELYDGLGSDVLLLDHYPVISVERVAHGLTAVLRVSNASASNQRATVKITSTGLTLTRVASGTTTTNTLSFATYPTLDALASAITALANGWSALAEPAYANFPSADLRAWQGAYSAKDVTANLRVHADELSSFHLDETRGALLRGCVEGPYQSGSLTWRGGPRHWRVIYSAGYSAVPEDVQEACAHWVAALFWSTKRDPGLQSEQIQGIISRTINPDLPPPVQILLAPYRTFRI